MLFLTDNDIYSLIKDEFVEDITDSDRSLIDAAERYAFAQVEAALRNYYDATTALSKKGDDRYPWLVMVMVDTTLYHLHTRISPNRIPESRASRYEDALKALDDVAKGKLDLPIEKKQKPNEGQRFMIGGYPAQDNRF